MNENKLMNAMGDPRFMIGSLLIFGSIALFVVGIFIYPQTCHYELYESNMSSMLVESGGCEPQRFIEERPIWLQKILTLGTDNIALTPFLIIGIAFGSYKLKRRFERLK